MFNTTVFESTLHYFNPRRMCPRVNIPESYRLHVAPSACGRRISIGAYRDGDKQQLSHLFISEDDVVSGCYEDLIPDAVEELLNTLGKRPRAIIIEVSCIDDLLGTDHDALLSLLSQRVPDVKFTVCHINPISLDGKLPPPVNMQKKFYGLLDRTGKMEDAVNLVGNNPPLEKDCEIYKILRAFGMNVKQISDCKTFEEFLHMADSRLNIVVAPMAQMAAEQMNEELGIPFLFAPGTFKIDEIVQVYYDIAAVLGRDKPDLSEYISQARKKIAKTLKQLGDMPIVVDSSSTKMPFSLAKALLDYGFNVKMVFDSMILNCDIPNYEWIKKNRPDIMIADAQRFDLIKTNIQLQECLCIGFNSAYTLGAKHMVELLEEKFIYGFYAIDVLMDMMSEACETTVDYNQILKESENW
ncbi:MAG: nitrogenase component 1 [Desulfosporosinus sp.]